MAEARTGEAPVVRTAGVSDVAGLARVLGRAFVDDPVMGWLFPGEGDREATLTRLFEVLVEFVHLPYDGADVGLAGAEFGGGALWDPPGHWAPASAEMLEMQSGFAASIGGDGERLTAATRAMDAAHVTEPHLYLAQIGTDPGHRGTGVGAALLRSRLAACDADGLPAYLESSNPANVPYFRRFGFEVTGEITAHGGPTMWAMYRPAQAG
ncbi:MAG TPA: GNAT family N-acetyltransferase [Streptosporangiaceae bacterium]|jgi:GNAT superfamily N-acetyltransferase